MSTIHDPPSRSEAKEKAEALLRESLTPEQQDQLDLVDSFLVLSEEGRQYRIERGRTGNVKELGEDGDPIASYCIHPTLNVPNADTMLVQKLLLETDEALFRQIANRTPTQ